MSELDIRDGEGHVDSNDSESNEDDNDGVDSSDDSFIDDMHMDRDEEEASEEV